MEMKTLKKIFTLVLIIVGIGVASLTDAEAQSLRDGNYNYIGKILPNGTVRNERYVAIGFFNGDGTIADRHGKMQGRVSTSELAIYDDDGKRIGFLTTDGRVFDGESVQVGTIDRNSGKVTQLDDGEEKTIGYAHGVSMLWIAAYYFFDFFD